MNERELGKILREMYDKEWGGGKAVAVHLFGIQFHKEIDALGRGAVQRIVVEESRMKKGYVREVHKCVKLGSKVRPIRYYPVEAMK